jgi:hypothetical protein
LSILGINSDLNAKGNGKIKLSSCRKKLIPPLRAASNKDELIKELSEKNEALMMENEDLRIKNNNLKSQLDEISGRWTEIALKE